MQTHIELKKYYKVVGGELDVYAIADPTDSDAGWRRPAVIVVPGGAYEHISKRESAPVACNFLAKGFQAFVLRYMTAPDGVRYPEQLHELAAAVDYVKTHSDEYGVNKNETFVLGFSAGGHLTADLAVEYKNVSGIVGEELDCKPAAIALGYPVINAKYGHARSHENLLSGYSDAEKGELLKRLNLDEAVTDDTVPVFIWTTAADRSVPAVNSLKFAEALAGRGVKYELHVYPEGDHGSSTCDFEANVGRAVYKRNAQWIENCISFFRMFVSEKY